MPYKLSEDGLCVVEVEANEVVKCHDTHEQAQAHLWALVANVEKDETGYGADELTFSDGSVAMPDDEKALDPDPTNDVAGGYTDSAIVAFRPRPEVAELLTGYCLGKLGTAEPPENLHVTLCYVTPDIQSVDEALEMLKATLQAFAQTMQPLDGKLNGVGRFFDVSEGTDCIYTNVDVPGLSMLREALVQVVREVIPASEESELHGFTPHMTLAYVPNSPDEQGNVTQNLRLPTIDIRFGSICLMWGETSYEYPLGEQVVEAANNKAVTERSGWGALFNNIQQLTNATKANELMGLLFDQMQSTLQEGSDETKTGAQLFFTDNDGLRYSILVSSNGYMDREGEWVRTAALQNYVDKRWIGDKFLQDNDFLLWHEGEPIGTIVWADTEGPYLLELAKELPDREVQLNDDVDEDGEPVEFIYRSTVRQVWDYLEQNPRSYAWGASIGFGYTPRQRGDYQVIEKFETSVLPVEWAANAQTFVGVLTDGNTN